MHTAQWQSSPLLPSLSLRPSWHQILHCADGGLPTLAVLSFPWQRLPAFWWASKLIYLWEWCHIFSPIMKPWWMVIKRKGTKTWRTCFVCMLCLVWVLSFSSFPSFCYKHTALGKLGLMRMQPSTRHIFVWHITNNLFCLFIIYMKLRACGNDKQ